VNRLHTHQYDLSILIKRKPKSDDEEESLVQSALQCFLKIMLVADATTVIPPYFSLDRNDRSYPDLSSDFQVLALEEFSSIKRYFSRLGNRNETSGKVYCSVILAQSILFSAVIHTALSALRTDSFGLYPRASDHESPGEIGWMCYSVRSQDEQRLSALLSDICGEHIGVKWKMVCTSEGFKKWDPADKSHPFAMHVEGPSNKLQECSQALSQWYGSASKTFLDGTKMRLIPPWHNIFANENKVKVGTLVACQLALSERHAQATTSEFSTNLLLDKPCPSTGMSLREVLMSIRSSKYPSCSLFHSIDKSWRDSKGVTFTFVPENESDGRMYVAGLIPYLRLIDEWYLSQFTEDAKFRHKSSAWDPETRQLFSKDELSIANNIYEDDDLNCTEEPTAVRPSPFNGNPDIEVSVPPVMFYTATPNIYKDSDSVSTFRSSSLLRTKNQKRFIPATQSLASLPPILQATTKVLFPNLSTATPSTASITLASSTLDDGSISKMSDTASRLSMFESRFDSVAQGFFSTTTEGPV
jgi:hypothetical protein